MYWISSCRTIPNAQFHHFLAQSVLNLSTDLLVYATNKRRKYEASVILIIMMQRIEFYDDFREFLKDYYSEQKKRFPHFSYRYFCKKADLTSPSHFLEIIEGKRKLTSKMLDSFIKGMALTEGDARYFTALVAYNQSKNSTEKQHFLAHLRGLKRKVKQALVSTDQFEFYAQWYNVVIRELACLIDWKEEYDLLAKAVVPALKKTDAKQSVEFLVRAGFIEKRDDGRYYQKDPAITSGSEVSSLGIRAYNAFMSNRAQSAIEEFPPSERDMQTLTIGISKEGYGLIKQEIQDFLSRVVRIVDEDKDPQQVYNVNVHLFPMSSAQKQTGAGDE